MYLKGLGKIMQISKGIRPVGGYLNLIRYKAFFDIFYCVPEHESFKPASARASHDSRRAQQHSMADTLHNTNS